MIVVTTPTGGIGRRLLDRLLDAGAPVRVISRDPSRLSPRVRERAEVVLGSHRDAGVLDEAFAGADAVFWVVPPDLRAENSREHYVGFTRPACEAIVEHGVGRVVGVSSLGRGVAEDFGLVSDAHAMDALIEGTGVAYRALRMPAFMEDVLGQVGSIGSQGAFFGSQSGGTKTPSCATGDIAAAAAELLLDGSWDGQGSFPVLGPEDISFDDMAEVMSRVLGRPVRYERLGREAHKAALMEKGAGEAYAQGIVDNQAQADRGIYNAAPRTPESTTPTGFREWCEEVLRPAVSDGTPGHGPAPVAGERSRGLDGAREELRAKDPVMRALIDADPDLDYDAWRRALPVEGLFEALLFQIVGQQISVKAGDAIYTRLRALFPDGRPDPEVLAETPIETLRGIGLSTRKAEYFRDIARRAADGELDGMADLSHEEARDRLVSFRGIGPWTADGALLITFGWPDVLVSGDLVLRKAVQRAYELPEMPSEKEVEEIGERWRPHRSLAAGYLFESMMSA